eukprot:evm.model.scf_1905.3 EVM.evm.TU.scf_1905.3   scf_1905:15545-20221(+)
MLWVDKHRPRCLDDFLIHRDIADSLKKLVSTGDCPHTLFYGPNGGGKKTLVVALLREIFGEGAAKVQVESRPWTIEIPGGRRLEVEMTTVRSNYHMELSPSDVGRQDRYVVQEIIKDMARNRPLGDKHAFKVLVLGEVDRLTKLAQHSLRRTMEKYSAACRLVMCCNNISKVIDPIRSRCLCIRVAAPPAQEAAQMLQHVASSESIRLPADLANRIVEHCGGNLRRCLLSLEVCHSQQYPFKDQQEIPGMDWENYIQEIVNDILAEQSPKRLYLIRGKLYELLANCIPPEVIFQKLVTGLLTKLDDQLKRDVCKWAAHYEHKMQQGAKAIFHLEAFVAKFMSIYKSWAVMVFG